MDHIEDQMSDANMRSTLRAGAVRRHARSTSRVEEKQDDHQRSHRSSTGAAAAEVARKHREADEAVTSSPARSSETDAMLTLLTRKLAAHIRGTEDQPAVSSQDMSNAMDARIDSFVQNELSAFSCPVCYELMRSPRNAPVLLFPCGHSFCEQCISSHISHHQHMHSSSFGRSRSSPSCPCCREPIASRALNHALRELIERFLLSTSSTSSGVQRTSAPIPRPPPLCLSSSSQGQLRSAEMRFRILAAELDEALAEGDLLAKKSQTISKATAQLLEERGKLDGRLLLLQEERLLIDQHLDAQALRQRDTQQAGQAAQERALMLRGTLSSLQREVDGLRLLVQGVRPIS